jgi:hypothetical protein
MNSVSTMYNEQMRKMQQHSMHSRLYDQLKAHKTKDINAKSFNSFSMNNHMSTGNLNDYKEDTKATEHFLR